MHCQRVGRLVVLGGDSRRMSADSTKRLQDDTCPSDPQPIKKLKLCDNENNFADNSQPEQTEDSQSNRNIEKKVKRRKVVLLLSYSGWGYYGMQRNPDTKTIEGDLLMAIKKAGLITNDYYEKPQLMLFQRAARTDKGVSAVRQVVSLKLPEGADIKNINDHLPLQIRVVSMKRTTKGFNSKVNCDARTYSYVLPTFAFSPPGEEPTEQFRISKEIVEKVNQVLKYYVGTHNFHNFTQKKSFQDASAKRYMHSFTCGDPFERDGREYIILTVKGQSFMQHHIRKMVGLAIAVLRGFTGEDTILKSFKSDPLDLPKAPGLGLMLEEVHYEGYNKRFGSDGLHEKLDWSEFEPYIQDFKEKHILQNILKTEEEEKSMLSWMTNLPGHSYSLREERPPTLNSPQTESPKDCVNNLKQHSTQEISNTEESKILGADNTPCSEHKVVHEGSKTQVNINGDKVQ